MTHTNSVTGQVTEHGAGAAAKQRYDDQQKTFRSVFHDAGKQAVRDGKITRRQLRRVEWKMDLSTKFTQDVMDAVATAAQGDHRYSVTIDWDNIDWTALKEFIQFIIDLITGLS